MKKTVLIFVLLFFILGAIDVLNAMPAFARKYQMSCKVCHSPFPKLKPYGEEFAANGFTLKDKEAPRYFADTGDEKVSLLRNLPFALRIEGFASLNNGNGKTLDLSTPYLIKLLSGGELFRNVSYYFYFFFSERGKVAGLEDAFLMFNEVIGELDIIVGQFQVSDPLFKGELRLSYEPYKIYKIKPGFSSIDLTYDRGPWTFFWGANFIGSSSNTERYFSANPFPQTYRGEAVDIVLETDTVIYHAASVSYLFENLGLVTRFGVSNLFNEEPPRVTTLDLGEVDTIGNSAFYSQYDWLGRRYFLNVTKTF